MLAQLAFSGYVRAVVGVGGGGGEEGGRGYPSAAAV